MELNTLDRWVTAHLSQNDDVEVREQEEVRRLLLTAAFSAAADRLPQLCPALASNQWLEFQLKKHQFMHLASLSTASADAGSGRQAQHLQEALALARGELAPLALHAYCEAYTDFKASMLALLSVGNGNGSSNSSSGSSKRNSSAAGRASGGTTTIAGSSGGSRDAELREFAGMVVRAVRQEVGYSDSQLGQVLRYLLLLHYQQNHSNFHPYWWPEVSTHTQQLCSKLLLPQRDVMPPAALEPLNSGAVLPGGAREHDVQALRTSLGCDREEAVMLLRRNRGSAIRGLQDALQAAHIDEDLLTELADEYAAWRGLDVPPQAQPQHEERRTEQHQHQHGWQPAASAASDQEAERMQVDEPAAQQGQQQGAWEREGDPEQRQQQRPSKLARKGPAEGKGGGVAVVVTMKTGRGKQAVREGAVPEAAEEKLELPQELSEQQLRRLMRGLESLLDSGQAEKAIEQLEAADPKFLSENPAATFALHRCRFLHQLASATGGAAAALAIARQHLSPLAQQQPELLQAQLKSALALLLPLPTLADGGGSDGGAAAAQMHVQQGVADALVAVRTALRPRCNIQEPRLLALLRELLGLHTAHFKLQRCQDRFASDLGITALKSSAGTAGPSTTAATAASPAGGSAAAAAAAAVAAEAQQALAAASGGGAATGQGRWGAEVPVPRVRELAGSDSAEDEEMGEGESDDDDVDEGDDDSDGAGVPEQAILTVCEFTGLPRHTAIELLLVHGGDPAAVLAHVFP